MAKLAPGSPSSADEASVDIALPLCGLQDDHDPYMSSDQKQISVVNAFGGATVLITGVTGFVGSVTLELLLRACPGVCKVILLIRSKAGRSGEERLDHLLHGKQLFKVHCTEDGKLPANLREKLQVVEGDISRAGCGLSAADASLIRSQVDYIIHCAASISFFEHIHSLLDQNYWATKHLADLAADVPCLRAFVHVSTAYVNAHLPKGSHVEEALYPLHMRSCGHDEPGRVVHGAIAAELAALPAAKAERRAQALQRGSGMPNNYTLTKHLAERLLDDLCAQGKLRVAIVRPSIVSGLAHGPAPGYCGNAAGFTSAAIAFASGMARFSCHDPRSVYDLIPCDIVASVILLAAAAASQQGQAAGAGGPALILHAASGTTNPASFAFQFERVILPYWQAEPPLQRLTCKAYKSIWAKNTWLPEGSLTFKRLRLKQGLRLRVMALALRMAGHARAADRLLSGWKVWKLYNTSTMDFNLFFCCAAVRRLHALLPDQERGVIRPLWQAPEDNWHAYLTACMDAVRAKYFPRVACGAGEAPQSSRSAKGSDLQGGKVIYAQAAAMLQREDTAHIPDTYQQDSIQA